MRLTHHCVLLLSTVLASHAMAQQPPREGDTLQSGATKRTILSIQDFPAGYQNLKHFPPEVLGPLNLEARSTDAFIADTIALDTGRAVAAIRRMRENFKKPEMNPQQLLIAMEAAGLTETVDILRSHVLSL
jgi:hypothetical protein